MSGTHFSAKGHYTRELREQWCSVFKTDLGKTDKLYAMGIIEHKRNLKLLLAELYKIQINMFHLKSFCIGRCGEEHKNLHLQKSL